MRENGFGINEDSPHCGREDRSRPARFGNPAAKPMKKTVTLAKTAGHGLEQADEVNVWLNHPRDFTSFDTVFSHQSVGRAPDRPMAGPPPMVDAEVEMRAIPRRPED